MASEPMWVFGYGSLIWNPNFPYEEKVLGHVKGYKRRFWQGSFVYSGTPQNPGRVVTLMLAEMEAITWGVAYKVAPENIPEVLAYLDKRENPDRTGYGTHNIQFYPKDEEKQPPFIVMTYIGTDTSPGYLGEASVDDLVKQVLGTKGKSSCNTTYVLKLANAIREIAPTIEKSDEEHLFSMEEKILKTFGDISSISHKLTECSFCGLCTACKHTE